MLWLLLSVPSGPAAPTDSISSTSAPPATVQHTATASSIARGALSSSSTQATGQCTQGALLYKNRGTAIFQTHSMQRTLFLMQWYLSYQDKECYYNPCCSCVSGQAAKKEAANRRPCPKTANHSATAFLWHPHAQQDASWWPCCSPTGQVGPGSAPRTTPILLVFSKCRHSSSCPEDQTILVSLSLKLLHVLPPSLLFLVDQPIFTFSLTASILKST